MNRNKILTHISLEIDIITRKLNNVKKLLHKVSEQIDDDKQDTFLVDDEILITPNKWSNLNPAPSQRLDVKNIPIEEKSEELDPSLNLFTDGILKFNIDAWASGKAPSRRLYIKQTLASDDKSCTTCVHKFSRNGVTATCKLWKHRENNQDFEKHPLRHCKEWEKK